MTFAKNSSDNAAPAETEPSPSTNASSKIQCTRSKLGFMPKSEPRHCRRSTVSGSPFGSSGVPSGSEPESPPMPPASAISATVGS